MEDYLQIIEEKNLEIEELQGELEKVNMELS